MRGVPIILVAALPFITGCNLVRLASFNTYNEPRQLATQNQLQARAEQFARDAWLDHFATLPDNCPPEAYEDGFLDGYADYLLRGGNGAPPAIPPPSYRRSDGATPLGHLEIKAYYVGFAAGAAAAKASGLRGYFLIPTSSPLPVKDLPTPDQITPETNAKNDRKTELLPPPSPPADEDSKSIPEKPAEKLPAPMKSQYRPRKVEAVESPITPVANSDGPKKPGRPVPPTPAKAKPPVPKQSAESIPLGPAAAPPAPTATAATPAIDFELPREFSVPILGGAGAR